MTKKRGDYMPICPECVKAYTRDGRMTIGHLTNQRGDELTEYRFQDELVVKCIVPKKARQPCQRCRVPTKEFYRKTGLFQPKLPIKEKAKVVVQLGLFSDNRQPGRG